MEIANEVIEKIKEFEGLRLESYRCASGVWTIGFGHTKDVKSGMKITRQKAVELLRADLEEVKKKVDANLNLRKLEVNHYQYSALCSFTFNCGSTSLARLTKDRTVDQIGQAILLYNKSNGTVLQGLVNRRQWESDYFFRQEKIDLAFSNFLFKTKPNYRVRKTANGSIIGSTKDGEYVQIKSITENWVETDKGWLHIDAFYFKLK